MRFAAAFTIEKEHFVNISKHFHKYGDSSDLQKKIQAADAANPDARALQINKWFLVDLFALSREKY